MPKSKSYKAYLLKILKDPKEAVAYLNAALEDEDYNVFLLALKDVVEARGGITKISKAAHLNRQHLYKILSEEGNPEVKSLGSILDGIGFQFQIGVKKKHKKAS